MITIVVSGVATGAIYALLAFGYCLIFKASKTVNLALGAVLLVGGYTTFELGRGGLGLSFFLAAILAVAVAGVIGLLLFATMARPLRSANPDALVVASIGIDLAIRSLLSSNHRFSSDSFEVGSPWTSSVELAGQAVASSSLWIIGIAAIILALLGSAVRWTTFGLTMRACAEDPEVAQAQGMSTNRNLATVWVVAGVLAAVAGILVGTFPSTLELTNYGWALRALPAVVLGGMDSLGGAVVGGLIVGLVETTTAAYQPDSLGGGFQLITPYLLMFVVLLARPQGLFGSKQVSRV